MGMRKPIITVLAHVDHGKTSLLDFIRSTTVAAKEAGGITQSIGTTDVPVDTIQAVCGSLLERFGIAITVPGLLFIDTPGHASFIGMRRRGGSIADIAVLVVDINEGFKPQTSECIDILKNTKTPFVVAVNKIDRIHNWQSSDMCFMKNYPEQSTAAQATFDELFYTVVGQLAEHGFDGERFDRVEDFTKKIAMIPVSAKTGEGIPELLTIITGLSQQFLKKRLEIGERCKGLILELKEVKGLGVTIDTIISDGSADRGDWLVISGLEPVVTKIKAFLVPEPLRDIRAEKRFTQIEHVDAAAGVKISAPGLEHVIAGSEFVIVKTEEEAKGATEELHKELESIEISGDNGLILKADTLGSLEALTDVFKPYPIKRATIGTVNKECVIAAEANEDEFQRVVIGFNVPIAPEAEQLAKDKNIAVLTSDIIYRLLEDYESWRTKKTDELRQREIANITRPAKFKILPGCIFRASNPAIVGSEIIGGLLKPGSKIFKSGDESVTADIKQIQTEGNDMPECKCNDRVALSINGLNIGRNAKEGDEFLTDITSEEYKTLRKYKDLLTDSEKTVLEEIRALKQSKDRFWGV